MHMIHLTSQAPDVQLTWQHLASPKTCYGERSQTTRHMTMPKTARRYASLHAPDEYEVIKPSRALNGAPGLLALFPLMDTDLENVHSELDKRRLWSET